MTEAEALAALLGFAACLLGGSGSLFASQRPCFPFVSSDQQPVWAEEMVWTTWFAESLDLEVLKHFCFKEQALTVTRFFFPPSERTKLILSFAR